MQPYEVVVSPFTVYVAPVGTAFPKIDDIAPVSATSAAPSGWTTMGTSGNKNYLDAGVTVTHGQTVTDFTPAGSTTPRKSWRTGETLTVGFGLVDTSPGMYSKVLDDAVMTTVPHSPSAAGEISFEMMRGVNIKQYALLVRGASSVDENLISQYEVYSCHQSGTPAPVYSKTAPAELACQFDAIELIPGKFGTLRIQTAPKG